MHEDAQTVEAIHGLAKQVDALGHALRHVADTIASAIRSTNAGDTGVSRAGTFT